MSFHYSITNTGNCPIYFPWYSAYISAVHDSSAPNSPAVVEDMNYGNVVVGTYDDYWNRGHITAEDVERGYIYMPPIVFSWTDPEGGKPMTASSNSLTLPVIGKTGLLVQKGISHGPANGSYFAEGEEIPWAVTVTNNGQQTMTNVTVTDQGVTVGAFAEIAPGKTETCAVPAYTVTAYDAGVGYVSNSAKAVGTNPKGAELSYFSNTVSVPTSAQSPVPLPPILGSEGPEGPGGEKGTGGPADSVPAPGLPETPDHPGTPGGGADPLGPVYGVNVAATVYKTDAVGPLNGD